MNIKTLLSTIAACAGIIYTAGAQPSVDSDDLVREGKLYLYDGRPFTGISVGHAPNTGEPTSRHYVEGKVTGVYTGYFDEERTRLKWVVPIVKGKQNGRYVHYYEDGSLRFTAGMKKGKLHGRRYCYTDEGILWHIHNYRRGKEHGDYTVYYEDTGVIYVEKHYRRDSLCGRHSAYDEDGNLRITGRLRNGLKEGVWNIRDRKGAVVETRKFRRDELLETVDLR